MCWTINSCVLLLSVFPFSNYLFIYFPCDTCMLDCSPGPTKGTRIVCGCCFGKWLMLGGKWASLELDSKAGFGVWSRGDGDAVDGEQEIGAPAGSVQRKRRVQRKIRRKLIPGSERLDWWSIILRPPNWTSPARSPLDLFSVKQAAASFNPSGTCFFLRSYMAYDLGKRIQG